MKKILDNPTLIFAAAFTIGLAPFVPEPHVWGKLKWVMGGGAGMQAMDWFDFIMHGTPWIFVIIWIGYYIFGEIQQKPNTGV